MKCVTKALQEAMRKLIAKVAASEKHFNALGTAVYYRTIRATKMWGRRGHNCQVVVNMGAANKSNLTFFTAIIFILVLLFTETFGQIVQNGGFESGK